MTTGLQLMLAAGLLVGAGVALLIWRLAPAEPDLADALHRLSPEHAAVHATTAASATGAARTTAGARTGRERIGAWALRTLPAAVLTSPPRQHLAMLRMTLARFYGEKVIFALVGLCLPAFVTTVLTDVKMLSASGSIMSRISSLTETTGLRSPQSAGAAAGAGADVPEGGAEHAGSRAPRTTSPAQAVRAWRR